MIKILHRIEWFLGLVLLQVLVLNHMHIGGYATPFFYIFLNLMEFFVKNHQIPSTITSLGNNIFLHCKSLRNICGYLSEQDIQSLAMTNKHIRHLIQYVLQRDKKELFGMESSLKRWIRMCGWNELCSCYCCSNGIRHFLSNHHSNHCHHYLFLSATSQTTENIEKHLYF